MSDKYSYQYLFQGKREGIKLDSLLRLIAEYETALSSRDANSIAMDSKASVILSATIALSLASIGFANEYIGKNAVTVIVLTAYSGFMALSAFFCMKVLWAKKQNSVGIIPHIRDVNHNYADEVMAENDFEFLIDKLDKLDAANKDMKRVTGDKSYSMIIAQNVFAYGSSALLLFGLAALFLRLC